MQHPVLSLQDFPVQVSAGQFDRAALHPRGDLGDDLGDDLPDGVGLRHAS